MRGDVKTEDTAQAGAFLPITATAPCRIDMGGTLDILTFYYPLKHLAPCTFNIAVGLRTRVRLSSHTPGRIRISSLGFESADYPANEAPFDHPLGLMFAIAACFRAEGIHIEIASTSPVKSALGGSSSAGVALVAALARRYGHPPHAMWPGKKIAIFAHEVETLVAQGPCGMQDQLAAVYGGVNAWYWRPSAEGPVFTRKIVVPKKACGQLRKKILLAYCGVSHVSMDVNRKWVLQFISGQTRQSWEDIVRCTHGFIEAMARRDMGQACRWMNRETSIRRAMTPDVLDDIGNQLVEAAVRAECGARFTGAGGGGCLWALGHENDIAVLKGVWEEILSQRKSAGLLAFSIDGAGVSVH